MGYFHCCFPSFMICGSRNLKSKLNQSLKMTPFRIYFGFFLLLMSVSFTSSSSTSSHTVLTNSPVEFVCVSSFAPSWLWFAPKQQRPKTLSPDGTKPHTNLKDPRFTFLRRDNKFFLRISDVNSADAGKFVCDGEIYQQIDLNVIR